MTTLQIHENILTRLRSLVCAGYPQEACGLLIGKQLGGRVEVREVASARNLNTTRAADRFELDPEDYLKADRAAQQAGLELVGIWHSHPDHPAHPSATDREFAWEGWSYLILSVGREGVAEMRSWRLDGQDFIEEVICS